MKEQEIQNGSVIFAPRNDVLPGIEEALFC